MTIFNLADRNGDGRLDLGELHGALRNDNSAQYEYETIRQLFNQFDSDHSGTIEWNEFLQMFKYLQEWRRCFQQLDVDSSGTIDESELDSALAQFGYKCTRNFVAFLIATFSARGSPKEISFDVFMRVCVTVKRLTELFRKLDKDGDGMISLNREEFMYHVIYNR
ncbi:EF-hand [Ramicandelaber brevisporus]|nr:EF-hand [Ramicandelaber brevisporus]